jgi:hypothetical protein
MVTPRADRLADSGPNAIAVRKSLNATSVFAPGPWSHANGALYFSGGGGNGLNVAGSAALLLTTCTFEVWAKTAADQNQNRYGCYYNTTADVFRARQNNGDDKRYGFDTQVGGAGYAQLVASPDDAWHHLCFSIYSVDSTWYLQCWGDGQSYALKTLKNYTTIDLGSSAHVARIGSGTNGLGDNPFIGWLSNLRISTMNRYGAGASAIAIPVPSGPFVSDSDTALLIPF